MEDLPFPLDALQHCTQLTVMHMKDGMAPPAAVLQALPLRILYLEKCTSMPSLCFLSGGALSASLTMLKLGKCEPRRPLAELEHLLQLRSLDELLLCKMFEQQPSPEQLAAFQPPSQRLIALLGLKP